MTADPSASEPIGIVKWSEEFWANAKPEVRAHRCKAHRKNGNQCRNPALSGATVCKYHGGAAKQVVNAARVRLQNAAEKMARELLGIATDTTVPEGVRLAAVKDALDRAGLKPVTAVDLDISTKPWEAVFEGISKVVAGPRYPEASAIESGSVDDDTDNPASESDDEVVVGEIDDDEIQDDPYLPKIQRESESGYTDVIDVEIMSDQPITPDPDDSSASGPLSPGVGPLGLGGPTGSGLMSLSDAVEAAADMRAREAARQRNLRRR